MTNCVHSGGQRYYLNLDGQIIGTTSLTLASGTWGPDVQHFGWYCDACAVARGWLPAPLTARPPLVRRALAAAWNWARPIAYYGSLIAGDVLSKLGRRESPDDVVEPEWERHGKLLRGPKHQRKDAA